MRCRLKEEHMYKKSVEDFEEEYPDHDIAALHHAHHAKRRERCLLKMQEAFRNKKLAEQEEYNQKKAV